MNTYIYLLYDLYNPATNNLFNNNITQKLNITETNQTNSSCDLNTWTCNYKSIRHSRVEQFAPD